MLSRLTSFVLFALLIVGYVSVKTQTDETLKARKGDIEFRIFPSPDLASILSFGFREATADIYWIEAVNYFGTQIARNDEGDYRYLKPFVDIIARLDPLFAFFYDWAATAYVYNPSPLTRTDLVESQKIANFGIRNLHEYGRVDRMLTMKAAFNYALEANLPSYALDYFAHLGRASRETRDFLMIGARYASRSDRPEVAAQLFEEFFSYKVFEIQSPSQMQELLAILTSPAFNSGAVDFLVSVRLQAEQNEDLRELVEKRFEDSPLVARQARDDSLPLNEEIEKLLRTDISMNWLPPELHLLLTL